MVGGIIRRMENKRRKIGCKIVEKCGEKSALTIELHKCPLPPTLFTNTTTILESIKKKKKKQRVRAREKKKRIRALAGTFLNEGEKERKEGGDKEIRTNVYGGKNKQTNVWMK